MSDQKADPPDSGWDERVWKTLACPACRQSLRRVAGVAEISCIGCGRIYPVEDDIPVLIVERATLPDLTRRVIIDQESTIE